MTKQDIKPITPYKAWALVQVCMNWRIRSRLKKLTTYAIQLGLIENKNSQGYQLIPRENKPTREPTMWVPLMKSYIKP